MAKELVEIVRCKDCIHRPVKSKDIEAGEIKIEIHDIEPPLDSRGWDDCTCPCLNEDDYWYSWYPSDDWFCAAGEEKED